jgi:putative chitinase
MMLDQLSAHFTLVEAIASSTATRMGIDNSPTVQQIVAMRAAAAGMEQVRTLLGQAIHVDSWLRVEALERALTVADYRAWCARHEHPVTPASWIEYFARKGHPKGYAVDFICPAFGTPAQIVAAIRASGIRVDQCIEEGTWVHISFDPQMRMAFMTASFVNGVPSYKDA